jgi:NAD-dependent deacetylase
MQDSVIEEAASAIAELVVRSTRIVVFTGAGISTESGIPDFRSPGGVWTKYNPQDFTYQKFIASEETRRLSWQRFRDIQWTKVRPNAAHFAVADLERLGKLACVITQNIDGLHQMAGNTPDKVIELHGTARWVACLDCGKRWPREEIEAWLEKGVEIPLCDACGGLLKSATISFGQSMPMRETQAAEVFARRCDLCIVIGSSLVVYPAAYMPVYAVESGAKLVIVNREATPLDSAAALVVHAGAGETMTKVLEKVKAALGSGAH